MHLSHFIAFGIYSLHIRHIPKNDTKIYNIHISTLKFRKVL